MKISTRFIAIFILTVTTAVAASAAFSILQFRDDLLRQATGEQRGRMQTFKELLRGKGEGLQVVDGKLWAGSYQVNGNNELPDRMRQLFGGTASIFQGETAVASNLVGSDGTSALGSRLDPAAFEAIYQKGRPYQGERVMAGGTYLICCQPISTQNGGVIGALELEVKKDDLFADYQLSLLKAIGFAVLMVALSCGVVFLLVRAALRPLARISLAARRIADGHPAEIAVGNGADEIGTLAAALNELNTGIVDNLKGEIDKGNRLFASIREAIGQLSGTTSHINVITTQQSSGASQQAAALQQVTITSAEIAATAKQITRNARSVEMLAEETASLCVAGSGDVDNATAGMARLKGQVQTIAGSMLKLGENSQKIGSIVEIIDEISDHANLLSLNASIEAAGAGESGKRFQIVAREVRRLAERTDEATREIKTLIDEIQQATSSTIVVTEQGNKGVDQAVSLVDNVQHSFAGIMDKVAVTARSAKEISLSTQQQTSACEQMSESMNEVRDVALQAADGARETERAIREVVELTDRLTELIETELQAKGKEQARAGARLMEKMLSGLVASKRLSVEELFDEQYLPIDGTDPQKYRTCYDSVFDQEIQSLLDGFVDSDGKVVYAVLADRNGYVPTHNTLYSRPLTGDRDKDRVWNRTKRMFNDAVGLAAARNKKELLVQMYFRDTGDKIWDISSPVYLSGRHWGAFRISYTLDEESAKAVA